MWWSVQQISIFFGNVSYTSDVERNDFLFLFLYFTFSFFFDLFQIPVFTCTVQPRGYSVLYTPLIGTATRVSIFKMLEMNGTLKISAIFSYIFHYLGVDVRFLRTFKLVNCHMLVFYAITVSSE
jgi:hypothetical protein